MTETMIKNLRNILFPNRAAPVLGKVIKAYEGEGKNKYSVDVQVIKAGSLEDTEQIIAEVPISPIWVGKKGKGIYAIPPEGSVVIVGFLEWNQAFPYVSGVWSDEYEAGEVVKEHLIITDGKGFKMDFSEGSFRLEDGKGMVLEFVEGTLTITDKNGAKIGIGTDSLVYMQSKQKTLKEILEKMIDKTASIKTMGSPPQHVVSPDSQSELLMIKQDISQFLKE
jgi:hypothetical protein